MQGYEISDKMLKSQRTKTNKFYLKLVKLENQFKKVKRNSSWKKVQYKK